MGLVTLAKNTHLNWNSSMTSNFKEIARVLPFFERRPCFKCSLDDDWLSMERNRTGEGGLGEGFVFLSSYSINKRITLLSQSYCKMILVRVV